MTYTGKDIKGYRIRDLIGEGGFGAVYTADQTIIGRRVAIKVIWPELAQNLDFIRQFEAEAKIVASLEHPHIVPLYDFWRDPEGAYMVMRLLRGGNLRAHMDKKWQVEYVSSLLNQLASAVTMAHRYGIIHRDIKPENILLDKEDRAYLTDFGIAQVFGKVTIGESSSAAMGSIVYAAPEQFDDLGVSPQTDQYSLALLVYELLANEHPFKHLMSLPHSQIRKARLSEAIPPITQIRPDLPHDLDVVLGRATALNERDRYPDTIAFARAFRDALRFKASQRAQASFLNDETLVRTPNGTILTADGVPVAERFLETPSEDQANPYRGLRAFRESDSLYFFGRERLIEHIVNRMAEDEPAGISRFLAIVGPSGSGKSSLIRAGVIPALREGAIPGSKQWFMVNMTPGTHPMDELEVALLQIATNNNLNIREQLQRDERGLARVVKLLLQNRQGDILLYIDQFEELFTLVSQSKQIGQFLDNLYHALLTPGSRLRLLVTLRADFYDRPLLYETFSHLIRERTEVVVPMTSEELNRAIVTPAKLVGVTFGPGLASTIVSEVSGQLGALPLLQYGLTELFDQRRGNIISLETYKDIGGILGALGRRAETIYTEMNATQQEATRQLFIRMVTLGEGTEDTRRRVLLGEIQASANNISVTQDVINIFTQSRLITLDHDPASRSPTLEVAHEAIIRVWSRLRGWLDESREDIRLQRNLSALATEWDEGGRDESYLLRGIRLEQYEQWQQSTGLALTQIEKVYLEFSIKAREARRAIDQARDEQQRALEKRAQGRLRILLAAMVIALMMALAFILRVQSENQQIINAQATSDANAAISNTLAVVANARAALAQDNTDVALALALAANEQSLAPPEAEALLAEIGLGPGPRWLTDEHNSRISRIVFRDQTGDYFISADANGKIILWDTTNVIPLQEFIGHTNDIRDLDISADGMQLVSVSDDGELILWDTESGAINYRVRFDNILLRSVSFTLDGQQILAGGGEGNPEDQIILLDAATGAIVEQYDSPVGDIFSVAAYSDGQHFLLGGSDTRIVLWNLTDDSIARVYNGHTGIVRRAIFNADKSRILSGAEDSRMLLWDTESGEIIQEFQAHSRTVHDVNFGPSELLLVSTSADSTIIIWNARTGERLNRFRSADNYAFSTAFIPGQMAILSGYTDGTLRRWDLTSVEQQWGQFISEESGLIRLNIRPTDGHVFTSLGPTNLDAIFNSRPELLEIDADTGDVVNTWDGHNLAISDIVFVDESMAFTVAFDGNVIRWDLSSGEQIERISLNTGFLTSLALTPDTDQIAVSSFNQVVHVLDVATGDIVRILEGHERPVISLAYHPNGRWLASGDDRGVIRLWDVATGETLRTFEEHTGIIFGIVFTRDGQHMLTGSLDSQVIWWDVESGEAERILRGHAAGVTDIALSPDEKLILSGAEDGSILLWSVETGAIERSFIGHIDAITGVAFTPSGDSAFSVGLDGSMHRWAIFDAENNDDLVSLIRSNRYVRPLSCNEQMQYRLVASCDE